MRSRPRAEILAQHAELTKKNWFELLGVKQDAPLDEVKSAYFKLAKQYHPDRFVATMSESELAKVRELSSRVNQAFQDLRNETTRQEYLKKLADPEREKKRLEASGIIEAMIDHEKGRMALKQSNFELALQHFQRASALHPGEAEYHFMIAQSLQRARGVENSSNRAAIESELRKAVDLQPNNAGYRIGIGHYWKARGEMEKAFGHYKEALKLDPKNHEAIREIRPSESRKEKEREERKRAAPSSRAGSARASGCVDPTTRRASLAVAHPRLWRAGPVR
ncbi:MAG: J domain-containing protein [Deltaproteobacteria bacterium]|nr:J domain-containing protein [Deltaproteobacteria bacterium]